MIRRVTYGELTTIAAPQVPNYWDWYWFYYYGGQAFGSHQGQPGVHHLFGTGLT